MQVYVFDIARGSFCDGPGIRTVVFLQGCPLRCPWCHNPESQKIKQLQAESIRAYSPEELAEIILKDSSYYKTSGGGVTFSGGEPLIHIPYLADVCRILQKENVSAAFDTSGFFDYDLFSEKLADHTDIVLFDLKIMNETKSLKITGVSSKPVKSNLNRLIRDGIKIRIRIPLIPGFTITDENLNDLGIFLRNNEITDFDLISYNPSFTGKLSKLGRTKDPCLTEKPLSAEEENIIRKRLLSFIETGKDLYDYNG
ncbi:MAG: radical SAM protein [Spirochaetes bacterium]|nr:radical SAM protein [Spirochaetota bacterium]